MVKKKHIEWSLLAPLVLGVLAVLCIVLYLVLPSNEMLQSMLGMLSMILIVVAGVSLIIPMVLVTIDIFQKKGMPGSHKIIWLVVVWLVLGYLAAAGYYFLEVRKRSDAV